MTGPAPPPRGEHARHVKYQVNAPKSATAVGKLECNPNGQWAWQPAETTDAIAEALTDQLQKGPTP